MVQRHFWLSQIEDAWRKRSIVWLSGVRRVGKTSLSQSLPEVEYFDCELPRVRRMMDDPEGFLEGLGSKRIVLDEIHRLDNPSALLKIAADHYPQVHILATGSSTLGASAKFRDTLAGRKMEVWLTPLMSADLEDFQRTDLSHRFLRGGLPPFFLAEDIPEREFQEWMDAYWAKDIQELFRLERRSSFQRFVELLLVQSGGIFEATRFTSACEVSRSTIANYLAVLEATFVVQVLHPFNTHRSTEIVAAPKVYGFDTGFVCYQNGWGQLRREDLGLLWEHYVLNELMAHLQSRDLRYWRDKRGHEVDLVLTRRGHPPDTIECKWSVSHFSAQALSAFRRQYPEGENFVVAADTDRPFTQDFAGIKVQFVGLAALVMTLTSRGRLSTGTKA
ncbi:MAG: ATP-binding protein [Deltaproteobacteria bacterium]|nr:ATP-binding protein [Deltaproteobacteria bacterium]